MPLFFLVGLRSAGQSNGVAVACGVLVVGGGIGTILFLGTATRKTQGRYRIVDVQKRDGDVAAYAATYLLPFVTVFSGGWRDLLSLGLFIIFLGVIYVRSRLIYVNPLLAFFGYHLWEVIVVTVGADPAQSQSRWPRYLIARRSNIHSDEQITAHRVLDDLLLDAGGRNP